MPEVWPSISVVICTRNRPQDVSLCLPTVLECDYPDFEVVLVDQSDADDTQAQAILLHRQFPKLRYSRSATRGKSAALNVGIALAQHSILAFTDDDCEMPSDWLRQIACAFAADERADVLFGPVLPSPSLKELEKIAVPSWVFTEERDLRGSEVCGMGANMAVRVRSLRRLPPGGLYDAALGPGSPFPAAEEGDFVYRLRRAGVIAALRPDMRVYHRAYRTLDHWKTVIHGYGMGDGAFYAKHARCGDFGAWRMIFAKLMLSGLRAGAKTLLRRDNNDLAYLRGFRSGLWHSRCLEVDRATRLYKMAEATCQSDEARAA